MFRSAAITLIAMVPAIVASNAMATNIAIDTGSAANGITSIYSATFDAALVPCIDNPPSYCSFFSGDPGPFRNLVVAPSPSGVINAVPLGFGLGFDPLPASGSFLNLTRNGTDTQLTLAGGTIAFPQLTMTIFPYTTNETIIHAGGAGMVFAAAPQFAALNADGQAEFLVSPGYPYSTVVDFSLFPLIVGPPNGSCAGPLCALVQILTLDMIRYRLFVDYDPTFTSFTADFIGQTANNSMVYATLNSAPAVVPIPATVWLLGTALAGLCGRRVIRRKVIA